MSDATDMVGGGGSAHIDRPYAVKGLMRVGLLRAELVQDKEEMQCRGCGGGAAAAAAGGLTSGSASVARPHGPAGTPVRQEGGETRSLTVGAREGDGAGPRWFAGGAVVAVLDRSWGAPVGGTHVLAVARRCVVTLGEVAAKLCIHGRPGLASPRAARMCFLRVRIHRAGPPEFPGGPVTALVSPVGPAERLRVGKDGGQRVDDYPWIGGGDDCFFDFSIAVAHGDLVWTRRVDLEDVGEGEMVTAAVGAAAEGLEAGEVHHGGHGVHGDRHGSEKSGG